MTLPVIVKGSHGFYTVIVEQRQLMVIREDDRPDLPWAVYEDGVGDAYRLQRFRKLKDAIARIKSGWI